MKSKMAWAPRRNFSASPDAALMESHSLIGRSVSLPLKRLLRALKRLVVRMHSPQGLNQTYSDREDPLVG